MCKLFAYVGFLLGCFAAGMNYTQTTQITELKTETKALKQQLDVLRHQLLLDTHSLND